MQYLVKKKNCRKSEALYVADTHTFNLKGKQIITLTDLKEFAQEFDLKEATEFIQNNPTFTIVENEEYFDNDLLNDEEEEDEDDE